MRDSTGKELKLGDRVVILASGGYKSRGNLAQGTVVGFTPKMIRVAYLDKRWTSKGEETEANRESRDVIYIGEGVPPKQDEAAPIIPAIPL